MASSLLPELQRAALAADPRRGPQAPLLAALSQAAAAAAIKPMMHGQGVGAAGSGLLCSDERAKRRGIAALQLYTWAQPLLLLWSLPLPSIRVGEPLPGTLATSAGFHRRLACARQLPLRLGSTANEDQPGVRAAREGLACMYHSSLYVHSRRQQPLLHGAVVCK
jgi:hypothetical protein